MSTTVINRRTGQPIATRVIWRRNPISKGVGLMFRRRIAADEAHIFDEKRQSRVNTAIHMFFVFFSIGVIWADDDRRVVDTVLARPFRPLYVPARPARYFIEGHPTILDRVQVGDELDF
ncbi:MAG: DUF192 domain-containing protein [Chloroflexi bacterium]|nr:DUF192 domain-containing protein [Chloroflexota bacterium]MBU1748698.1 DUF192 domain-containing protein [Chloroflexota bacterium]